MTAPSRPARQVPPISERDFQRQVTDLAELFGWQWAHFRPAQTSKGWRTPVSGPLGKGWFDLILVRPKDRRLIFAELKRDGAKFTADQERVFETLYWLQTAGCYRADGRRIGGTSIEVCRWWPTDFDDIAAMLR